MNGLLVCKPTSYSKNIGDYIQSVAQELFYDKIDMYCEREELNRINASEKINLIMNGWFMWRPENFPPSECINPLFVSFHLVPSIADKFFTKETLEYLKRYEPIGARDLGTMELLEKYGVKSYFSSCLTLVLGMKYKCEKKNDEILFVDPYYRVAGTRENMKNVLLYLKNITNVFRYGKRVSRILNNFQYEYRTVWSSISKRFEKLVCACAFYADYKDAFTDDVLLNAKFITHTVKAAEYPSNDKMMEYARILIEKYSKAKLVVTSRIHCALPCLAVETPVIYVQSKSLEKMEIRSPGRMGGLIDLFTVLQYNKGVIIPEGKTKIDRKTKIENKKDYLPYKEALIKIVKNFVNNAK